VATFFRVQPLAAFLLAVCASHPASAQTKQESPAGDAAAFKRLTDPTDFRSRTELRNEYQSLQSGGSRNVTGGRFDYALSNSFLLRIDVPYVMVDPDAPGISSESGLGDISVRAQWRALRKPEYALVVAAEVALDTAQEPLLGTGRYVFQPLAFASVDVPKYQSVVFPYVQQFWSFGGTSDRDINTTLLRAGVLKRWPRRTYTYVEPSLYVDWVRDGRTGFTLEVELGRFFTKSLGLYLRPGVGLWGDNVPPVYNWNFEVGMRYLFQ
jgi:hypothetical protein